MGRLFSSAVFIIIHAWQIIMHKRISVYHFQRSHKRFRHFPLTAKHTVSLQKQHRAQTLPARQYAIIHRFHNRLLVSLLFRKILPDYRFNFLYFFFQFPVKTHPFLHSRQFLKLSFPPYLFYRCNI